MDNILKQLEEDIRSYKIRLCKNKELYDLTWQDIADLVNKETGEKLGSDVFRKFWRYYQEGYQDAIENKINDEEVLKDLEQKKIEFISEKIKYQDQKREYMKLIRNYTRAEHLKEEIFKLIEEINEIKPLRSEININYINDSNKEGVLVLSDWHKGMFVEGFFNNYNDEVFRQRIKKLVEKTVQYGKFHKIKILHVFVIGDLINGLIRLKTRITNEENIVKQIQQVSETLSEMLCIFAEEFEYIKVYNALDNHGRIIANKDEEIPGENFLKIIPWYLQARLNHIKNIKVVENKYDDEIIVTDVCSSKIFGLHGHRDKVNDVVENWSLMLKVFPDYVFLSHGHHHEENETHGVEIIVNSSLSGTDEYSKEIRKTSKSAQKFVVFDDEEGRLCTYNIKL